MPLAVMASLLGVVLMLWTLNDPEEAELEPSPPTPSAALPDANVVTPRPRIDVHTHLSTSVARRGLRALRAEGIRIVFNASGGASASRRARSQMLQAQTGGKLRWWCNLSFQHADADGWLEHALLSLEDCAERGGAGLKVSKALGLVYSYTDGQLIAVDDPLLDPVFAACGRLDLTVLIHTADPKAFFDPPTPENERYAELSAHPSWSFYGERPEGAGPWPSWLELLAQLGRRIERHPETRFLGAHFGNSAEEPARVWEMLDRYPNYFVETGARLPELGRHDPVRLAHEISERADRILFGSDIQMGPWGVVLGSAGADGDRMARLPNFLRLHWRYFETSDAAIPSPSPIQGNWSLAGIALPDSVLDRIYWKNAVRLFNLGDPESIDWDD